MTLTNLTTVLQTVTMASVKLTVPADRIGLGFGTGLAYPADSLSLGHFPVPNPEPEQVRSRGGRSATQTRKPMRTGEPNTVAPVGSAGCFPPGPRAVRVSWPLTVDASRSVQVTDTSRNRDPKTCARFHDRDCQSQVWGGEKHGLTREAISAAAAGK
jgi:hypothetical protein